jgi:hypothetical protein
MDDLAEKHLENIYGLNPNIPHMAFQFPRLPPRLGNPMFNIKGNPAMGQLSKNMDTMNQKLQGFQHLYQQHAAGLLSMSSGIIPPGHPLYTKQNSIHILKSENDKLLKENTELKKKLEKKDS